MTTFRAAPTLVGVGLSISVLSIPGSVAWAVREGSRSGVGLCTRSTPRPLTPDPLSFKSHDCPPGPRPLARFHGAWGSGATPRAGLRRKEEGEGRDGASPHCVLAPPLRANFCFRLTQGKVHRSLAENTFDGALCSSARCALPSGQGRSLYLLPSPIPASLHLM